MEGHDRKAEELRIRIHENIQKKKGVFMGASIGSSSKTYRENINENIDEVKKLREKKRKLLDELNGMKDEMRELDSKKNDLNKNIPRNYHTEDDLKQAIAQKQNRYETTSLKTQEERQLLADIDKLKTLFPLMKQLQAIEPKLNGHRKRKQEISAELDKIKGKIDGFEDVIQDAKAKSQNAKDKDQATIDEAEKYNKLINEGNEDLSALYRKKDEQREEHFKAMYEYELQQAKMKYMADLKRKKDLLVRGEKELNERIEKKREEIANRPNPNAEKIEACGQCIKYCQSLKKKHGLVPATSEEVAQQVQKEFQTYESQKGLQQKLENKSIQMYVKQEEVVQVGNPKGKKGKKQKSQKETNDSGFQVDFAAINWFGLAGISPPGSPEQLDDKIKELEEKSVILEKSGQADLDKEKAELEKTVVSDAQKELEKEEEENRKNIEDQYGYAAANDKEEDKREDEGDDSDEKPKKGNRDGGYFGNKNNDSDDDFTSDAYAKPSRGGGKVRGGRGGRGRGGRAFGGLSKDDFPEL